VSVTAWDVLGLAETDDVRSIKRAYAKALKQARPDEDPAGFQQLTSAYEWALGYASHCAHERAASAAESAAAETEATASPSARGDLQPHETEETAIAAPKSEAPQGGFDFGPFFEQMGEQILKGNPLHLKEWLEAHPDMYSIELKWALIPHVFDALAHNAAALDPNRGHLATLQTFFGVDATLRAHPAIAPAIDFLESKAWKQPPAPAPEAPMPAGWENLDEVMGRRRPPPRQSESQGIPWWLILMGLFLLGRIAAAMH